MGSLIGVDVRYDGQNARRRRSVPARDVAPGDRFMRRSGLPSEPVREVRVVRDSFGTETYVEARLANGQQVIIALDSSVRVYTERAAGPGFEELLALPVREDTAEAALVAAAREHPDDVTLLDTALRLGAGINPRAGAHLDEVVAAADRLVVVHDDEGSAAPLLAVLTGLGYDGNAGRWHATRHALALAAWLAFDGGDTERAETLGAQVRVGEDLAIGELRGPTAEIRRRQLAEPHFPDREIQRAHDAGSAARELQLRWDRLDLLLCQLAAGWAGMEPEHLRGLVANEVDAIRALSLKVDEAR